MQQEKNMDEAEQNPFAKFQLDSHDALRKCKRRPCPGGCGKQRRYYCSHCLVSLLDDGVSFPVVKLPFHIQVLQSGAERPQQSTAQHIGMLASADTTIWRPFPECVPAFEQQLSDAIAARKTEKSIAILYPCEDAIGAEQAADELLGLKHLLVVDASWTKSAVVMDDLMDRCPWINDIPKVRLPSDTRTRFWRYAPLRSEQSRYFSPEKSKSLVSTVEAVHSFCDSFQRGKEKTGQYDNLLWLFAFMHCRVREVYEENPGKRDRIMRKSKGLLRQF